MRFTIVMKLSSKSQYQIIARRFRSIRPMLMKTRSDEQILPLKSNTIKKIATNALTRETVSSRGKSLYCYHVMNLC